MLESIAKFIFDRTPFWLDIVLSFGFLYGMLISIPFTYFAIFNRVFVLTRIYFFWRRFYGLVTNKPFQHRYEEVVNTKFNYSIITQNSDLQFFMWFWIKAMTIGFGVMMTILLGIVTFTYIYYVYPEDREFIGLKTLLLQY
ncbi:MAG: hypothetical protein OHK0017_02040 [Patescibacteria group bacterium]